MGTAAACRPARRCSPDGCRWRKGDQLPSARSGHDERSPVGPLRGHRAAHGDVGELDQRHSSRRRPARRRRFLGRRGCFVGRALVRLSPTAATSQGDKADRAHRTRGENLPTRHAAHLAGAPPRRAGHGGRLRLGRARLFAVHAASPAYGGPPHPYTDAPSLRFSRPNRRRRSASHPARRGGRRSADGRTVTGNGSVPAYASSPRTTAFST